MHWNGEQTYFTNDANIFFSNLVIKRLVSLMQTPHCSAAERYLEQSVDIPAEQNNAICVVDLGAHSPT